MAKAMKCPNGSLVLWVSLALIFIAPSTAGAAPGSGYVQTSDGAHSAPDASQNKNATALGVPSDYVKDRPRSR